MTSFQSDELWRQKFKYSKRPLSSDRFLYLHLDQLFKDKRQTEQKHVTEDVFDAKKLLILSLELSGRRAERLPGLGGANRLYYGQRGCGHSGCCSVSPENKISRTGSLSGLRERTGLFLHFKRFVCLVILLKSDFHAQRCPSQRGKTFSAFQRVCCTEDRSGWMAKLYRN